MTKRYNLTQLEAMLFESHERDKQAKRGIGVVDPDGDGALASPGIASRGIASEGRTVLPARPGEQKK
jgi:hypothetical protein